MAAASTRGHWTTPDRRRRTWQRRFDSHAGRRGASPAGRPEADMEAHATRSWTTTGRFRRRSKPLCTFDSNDSSAGAGPRGWAWYTVVMGCRRHGRRRLLASLPRHRSGGGVERITNTNHIARALCWVALHPAVLGRSASRAIAVRAVDASIIRLSCTMEQIVQSATARRATRLSPLNTVLCGTSQ